MNPYFDYRHTVDPDEIDAQEHVHNLRYLQWTLWAARDHSAAMGWDSRDALERGLGWVVRAHDITYRAAALANDEILIRTWVSDISRYASVRQYAICRPIDRTVLARASTRWVFVDLKRHRALAIPQEAKDAISLLETPPPLPWDD